MRRWQRLAGAVWLQSSCQLGEVSVHSHNFIMLSFALPSPAALGWEYDEDDDDASSLPPSPPLPPPSEVSRESLALSFSASLAPPTGLSACLEDDRDASLCESPPPDTLWRDTDRDGG